MAEIVSYNEQSSKLALGVKEDSEGCYSAVEIGDSDALTTRIPPSSIFGDQFQEFESTIKNNIKTKGVVNTDNLAILAELSYRTNNGGWTELIGPVWGNLKDGLNIDLEEVKGASKKVTLQYVLKNGNEIHARLRGGIQYESGVLFTF